MKTQSLAGKLLETIHEDDAAPGAALLKPGQGPGDAPNDKDAKPAAAQPDDKGAEEVPAHKKIAECMDEPNKMAECLEAMDAQCAKYMDEADPSTYTCPGMNDKEDVEKAQGAMKEAMGFLKGKMKK